MQKTILIVHTGGTIGMTMSDQGYVTADNFTECLGELLSSQSASQLPDYHIEALDTLIDSANLVPNDWNKIAHVLMSNWDKYDGFVVLHGTDTMAYTASALSFMLTGINKPVILTGSQIPLAEVRNDAQGNIVSSLLLASENTVPEVCIFFNGKLLRGNRSRKLKSVCLDAFDSPNFPALGEVDIHVKLRQDLVLEAGEPAFSTYAFESEAVVVVPIYPGISANVIDALLTNTSVKALILQTYGVGNPPDANQALLQRLEQAHQEGIVIVNLTQCLYGGVFQGTYATGSALNRIGVVSGGDLTLEAAFTKLHCLISQGYSAERIRELMPEPLCGECQARE